MRKIEVSDDLVNQYYNRLDNNDIIYRIKGINGLSKCIKEYLEINHYRIITGRPSEIKSIIRDFSKNNWDKIVSNMSLSEEIQNAYGYSTRFRSNKNRAVRFGHQLNVKACPYCNSQYTLSYFNESKEKVLFEFDHFYPKSVYPYLSVSLFNLIPSCSSCNRSKSDKGNLLIKNPYEHSIHFEFKFKYKPIGTDFYLNNLHKILRHKLTGSVELDWKDSQMKNDYENTFHLKELYNQHLDIVAEVKAKSILYNNSYFEGIKSIQGLFSSLQTDEIKRLVLGNYTKKEDINKRPLSKFQQDLWEEFGGG